MVDETAVVEAAATAAQEVIFSRLGRDAVTDLDVRVTFEADRLEVDVYVEAPDADEDDVRQVVDDAALAARAAADDCLA
ncbi:MAG: DUF3194 domain-containing protein [Halobacteriaceae archaeon]